MLGDGPDMYQLWVGGSPVLTHLAFPLLNKVKWDDMDKTIEPLFKNWKENRHQHESFGEFCTRVGAESLLAYSKSSA